jgi:hypothetical protein
MERDLLDDITTALDGVPSWRVLPAEEATGLLDRLAARYGMDPGKASMWEMPGARALYPYDLPGSWELMLGSLLDIFSDVVYLVVTDGVAAPWPVIALPPGYLLGLLPELPGFEYFVFDEAMERVVFDTHQGELVVFEK